MWWRYSTYSCLNMDMEWYGTKMPGLDDVGRFFWFYLNLDVVDTLMLIFSAHGSGLSQLKDGSGDGSANWIQMAIVQFKFMTVCQEKIQLNGFLSSRIPMNIIILSMIKPAGIIQVTTIFAIFKSSDVWQSNYHFLQFFMDTSASNTGQGIWGRFSSHGHAAWVLLLALKLLDKISSPYTRIESSSPAKLVGSDWSVFLRVVAGCCTCCFG